MKWKQAQQSDIYESRRGRRRQVIDLIRGKMVGDARSILTFTPLHAARIVKKILDSAVANAEQKKVGDLDSLMVDQGVRKPGRHHEADQGARHGQGKPDKKEDQPYHAGALSIVFTVEA